jgi:hypothetical protein
VLSVTTGTWTGTAPITYAYQVTRNGTPVGAPSVSQNYTIPDGDLNALFGCIVTATNSAGNASAAAALLYVGVMDVLSVQPALNLGLRRESRSYTGLNKRVRRSSDNVESNFGFATAAQTRTNLAAIPINNDTGQTISGVTMTTVGTGTEFGQPYIDVRWQGTAGGTAFLTLGHGPRGVFNPALQAPVTPGLNYTASVGYRLLAGTFPTTTFVQVVALFFSASGAFISDPTSTVPAATAALQRGAAIGPAPAGAAYCQPIWRVLAVSGAVVDFTMRFYTANVELGTGNARPLLQRNVPETVAAIGELDAEALLNFVGNGDGFITILHDKSGNGRNATQTTPGSQPQIVSNGAIITMNGRPAPRFDGSNDSLTFQGVHDAEWSLVVAGLMNGNAQAFLQFGNVNEFGSMFNEAGTYRARAAAGANASAPFTPGEIVVLTATYGAAQINIWKNGSIGTPSDDAGVASNAVSSIGTLGTIYYLNGNIGGISVLNGVLSTADRQILERNRGAYYGIPIA